MEATLSSSRSAKSASSSSLTIIEPATGKKLGEVPLMGTAEVQVAVSRARAAQARWASLSPRERALSMQRFRDEVVKRADELVDTLVKECGKPKMEALVQEVMVTADLMTFYIKRGPAWLAPRRLKLHLMKHRRSELHYFPRGVVGIISLGTFLS
ncbi:MAG: aldehyde dehydrogenase family protein [Myxococcales bacterium]|nr:MAG: aldehyde dehydrogenase family protein [Myxococcales bacterium]